MRHIVSLAPDVIKVDRSLVEGIDNDAARRAMVASLVVFALQLDATVVAEGVETAAELETLAQLGVDDAQGFWLARPSQSSADWHRWTIADQPSAAPEQALPGPRGPQSHAAAS